MPTPRDVAAAVASVAAASLDDAVVVDVVVVVASWHWRRSADDEMVDVDLKKIGKDVFSSWDMRCRNEKIHRSN